MYISAEIKWRIHLITDNQKKSVFTPVQIRIAQFKSDHFIGLSMVCTLICINCYMAKTVYKDVCDTYMMNCNQIQG